MAVSCFPLLLLHLVSRSQILALNQYSIIGFTHLKSYSNQIIKNLLDAPIVATYHEALIICADLRLLFKLLDLTLTRIEPAKL